MSGMRRRVWWVLPALSILIIAFGVGDVILGATADPGIAVGLSGMTLAQLEAEGSAAYRLFDFFTRTQGIVLVAFGVLLTVVLLIPYRGGRRWAWYAGWIFPGWAIGVFLIYLAWGIAPDQPSPPPMVSGPILGLLAAMVLLIDRPRFTVTDTKQRA